jgi:Putative metallopeptidase
VQKPSEKIDEDYEYVLSGSNVTAGGIASGAGRRRNFYGLRNPNRRGAAIGFPRSTSGSTSLTSHVAAYYLLQFGGDDTRRLIAGAAYAYNREASLPSLKKNPFADEHGLPAQRFYNILCTAYGKDSRLFTDVVEKSYLPKERAENCKDEYAKVVHAMKILIDPDIDETVARQVKAKRWLRF